MVTAKVITPVPLEFRTPGTISWNIFNLDGRDYDAILGLNILIPFRINVNLGQKYIEINKERIEFDNNNCPIDPNTIYSLEPVDQLLDHVNLGELNQEEIFGVNKLLKEYKDLFYMEGDDLTFTHEITHEIVTTTNNPVYSKIYRYPKVHEEGI